MFLYSFALSSASYRVRIALKMKGIPFNLINVNLAKNEDALAEYLAINPQGLVPTLVDGSVILSQSTAIIEYLDEVYNTTTLLPRNIDERVRVRSICQFIACEMQPLTNVRVRRFLEKTHSSEYINDWNTHWVIDGLQKLDAYLANDANTGKYCHGDEPTMADVYLVPQMALARRFVPVLSQFKTLTRIENNCLKLPAFTDEADGYIGTDFAVGQ